MPIEIHIGTVAHDVGVIGVLPFHTTEGLVDISLDLQPTDAIVDAINTIRSSLDWDGSGI